MKNQTKNIAFLVIALVAIIAVASWLLMSPNSNAIKQSEFEAKLAAGQVAEVYIDNYNMAIRTTDSKHTSNLPKNADFTTVIDSRLVVTDIIREYNNALIEAKKVELAVDGVPLTTLTDEQLATVKQVNFAVNDPNEGSIWSTLYPILTMVVLVVLGVMAFRALSSNNKQAMNFGKTKGRVSEQVKVRFNDVAGAEEEKEELAEVVEFLKSPAKFTAVGARIPKGVLLVGPPGTGKTLFAKAVAGEANVPFFSISGSDFVEMYVGVGASRVRDLFEQAKRNMPCIIFIDEIDAVGRKRGAGLGGGHDEREQTLNQLLVQMDGFEKNEGIIVMAATNRADILDPALMRPGRFDRQIFVHVPDIRGREQILKVHARNKPIGPDVDFKIVAKMTIGFTGADIENLLNEAAILCARNNRKLISMLDVNEGINKVIIGPQKKSRLVTEFDKRVTAYHEAGHAVLAMSFKHCDKVHEVSIIPRGRAAGYTLMRPEDDKEFHTVNQLLDDIAMSLGGRAAEAIFIQDIGNGASADIQGATARARKMVTEWGMSSEIGPIYVGGGTDDVFLGRDFSSSTHYSESLISKVDAEVKKILDNGYTRAVDTLTEKKSIVEKMVRLLVEHETIYAEEVEMLMQDLPLEEINQFIEKRNNSDKPLAH